MSLPAVTRPSTTVLGRALGGLLIGAGVLHFAYSKPFDAIVPDELPGPKRAYTHASGLAEVITGGLLLAPATRRRGGLLATLLLILVFPGNINAVRVFWGRPALRAVMIARLPLQVPLIAAAVRLWRAG